MTASAERWWIAAVLALVLAGVATIALLAWPERPRDDATPVRWEDIAPAAGAPPRAWRWIVVHHSGTAAGDSASIDRAHALGRGWDGIGYHFVIGNGQGMPRGRIEATFRWRDQRAGAHAGADDLQRPYNEQGIGICVVGDYRGRGLDPVVEARLADLCAVLVRHHPGLAPDGVVGHRDVPGKATACPGDVDLARLRALIRTRLP